MFSLQRGPFIEDFFQCVNFDFYQHLWQEQLYFLATLLLLFVIPLMIMITCYTLIFCTISRKSKDFGKSLIKIPGARSNLATLPLKPHPFTCRARPVCVPFFPFGLGKETSKSQPNKRIVQKLSFCKSIFKLGMFNRLRQ
jgi:hypothetical protein